MAIIRWSPLRDLMRMREAMDEMFDEDWSRFPEVREFAPAVDVYQTKDKVVVETALPGVDPDKVDISVEDDTLVIKGKTQSKEEKKEKDYYRKEVRYGSFYRAVALPASVKSDKAQASYEDGILKVTLPKMARPKAKRIAVKVKKSKP